MNRETNESENRINYELNGSKTPGFANGDMICLLWHFHEFLMMIMVFRYFRCQRFTYTMYLY